MIEVADIRGHYSTQTSFAEDEYVVEALGTHRFDPTLRNRIRSRRPERRPDLLNAKVSHAALERRTITAVAVVNEKTWRPSIPSAAFDYLLGSPLRRRTWRYRDVQNFSIDVPDHKKDAQRLEPDCSNTEEVARPYIRFMPFQELSPFRRWPSIVAPTHVLGDGPGRNAKSQSCEFSLNPLLTPEPIFSGHPPDERLKLLGNWSSPPPPPPIRSPGPVSTPTASMPPQNCLGLHDEKRIAPTGEQSTRENPELPVPIAQARLLAPALQHPQLLP
jgi:hypothetical protein